MIHKKYTHGVWYDAHHDDFNRIERDTENDEVVFCNPETGEELERIDPEDFDGSVMYKINEGVATNPQAFLEDRLERMADGYYGMDDGQTTYREEVCVKYALERCEIIDTRGEDDE